MSLRLNLFESMACMSVLNHVILAEGVLYQIRNWANNSGFTTAYFLCNLKRLKCFEMITYRLLSKISNLEHFHDKK